MYTADKFEYSDTVPAQRPDVTIGNSVQGKQELLNTIAQALDFPDYFGENWDALIDCLGDLSWLMKSEVVIDHESIPNLSKKELRLYLESLIDAKDRMASNARPALRLLFRNRDRPKIVAALGLAPD